MNCHYHPDRSAVTQCVVCGKNLCNECIVVKDDQPHCKDCIEGVSDIEMREIVFPSLICGIIAGFLSAVPGIDLLNCIFCMWIIIGGALAVYLLKNVNKIKGKISMGKAAITGAFTGFIASIVMWLVASVRVGGFSYELRRAMMQPEFQEAFGDIGASSEWVFGLVLAIMIVITGILFAFFGALGGIISNELVK